VGHISEDMEKQIHELKAMRDTVIDARKILKTRYQNKMSSIMILGIFGPFYAPLNERNFEILIKLELCI
jgi:hypothetical protein